MERDIVDQLVICLFDQSRNVPLAIRERGYTQDQIAAPWTEHGPLVTRIDTARKAPYSRWTGAGGNGQAGRISF
jgi:hypothetical protein